MNSLVDLLKKFAKENPKIAPPPKRKEKKTQNTSNVV